MVLPSSPWLQRKITAEIGTASTTSAAATQGVVRDAPDGELVMIPDHLRCCICLEAPWGKIEQCINGHLLCGESESCAWKLRASYLAKCPVCHVYLSDTIIRGLAAEQSIAQLRPDAPQGLSPGELRYTYQDHFPRSSSGSMCDNFCFDCSCGSGSPLFGFDRENKLCVKGLHIGSGKGTSVALICTLLSEPDPAEIYRGTRCLDCGNWGRGPPECECRYRSSRGWGQLDQEGRFKCLNCGRFKPEEGGLVKCLKCGKVWHGLNPCRGCILGSESD